MEEEKMLTLEKFEEASEVVRRVTLETKLVYSDYFSQQTGAKVFFKPENLQFTGAYKVRGAYYKMSTLTEEERAKGVITASAGNHAQGVAYAAKCYGAKATIVMPTTTPLIKVNRTKGYGAEVVLYGDVYDEACAKAYELAEEHGYTFVHPFDDLTVATGQGTIAMEIVKELPLVDYILVPIGGGGLATGVSTLAKLLNLKGKKVVSILSGGNMDVITMSSVVQQGLILRDRIFTVSVLLPDKPGELSKVAAVVAKEHGNVIKLSHNQFVSINRSAAVELRITMESFGTEHKQEIISALEKEGYRPKVVQTNM